jgi:hypothetical protein
MDVQQLENSAPAPEYSGLTFEKVWTMFRETDKKFQETDKKFQETQKEIREGNKQLQKVMGDLGKKFGTIIEHMFIPNLNEKFNLLGFQFEKSSTNVLIGDKTHKLYAEIDVFLENGDSAVVVEIKTQANINDVRDHVERMELLRRHFDLHNDKRKLYGALAAAIFPDNVLDYAKKQGFYIIRQSGDSVSIETPGKAKAW